MKFYDDFITVVTATIRPVVECWGLVGWWWVRVLVRWSRARCPLTVRLTSGSSIDRLAPLCSFRGQRSPPLQTCFLLYSGTRRAAATTTSTPHPPRTPSLCSSPWENWGRQQLKRFSPFRFSSCYLLKFLFKGEGGILQFFRFYMQRGGAGGQAAAPLYKKGRGVSWRRQVVKVSLRIKLMIMGHASCCRNSP